MSLKKIKAFIMSINVSGVNVWVWVRLIMLVLMAIVFIMKLFGVTIPLIDETTVSKVVVGIIGLITFAQVYWKNNSLTDAAQQADKIMIEKKNQKKEQ